MTQPGKPGEAAQGQPPKLTAKDLRILAETADGMRDKGGHIVVDSHGKARWRKQGETGGIPVMEITPSGDVYDPDAFELHAVPAFNENLDIKTAFDAMFWTRSALRKFAFPYYAGYEDSGKQVERLIELFGSRKVSNGGATTEEVVAFGHSPSSDPTSLTTSLKGLVKVSGGGLVEHLEVISADHLLR